MDQAKRAEEDRGLRRLVGRVEQWRRQRAKRGPMPEALWDAAVELSLRLGVSAVSRAAGVSYPGLKSRVRARESTVAGRPGFIELTVPGLEGTVAGGCELVLERPDGIRLTIRQPRSADVAALVSALLGGGSCSS